RPVQHGQRLPRPRRPRVVLRADDVRRVRRAGRSAVRDRGVPRQRREAPGHALPALRPADGGRRPRRAVPPVRTRELASGTDSVPAAAPRRAHPARMVIREATRDEHGALGRLMVAVYSTLDGFPGPDEQPAYYAMLVDVGRLTEQPGVEL